VKLSRSFQLFENLRCAVIAQREVSKVHRRWPLATGQWPSMHKYLTATSIFQPTRTCRRYRCTPHSRFPLQFDPVPRLAVCKLQVHCLSGLPDTATEREDESRHDFFRHLSASLNHDPLGACANPLRNCRTVLLHGRFSASQFAFTHPVRSDWNQGFPASHISPTLLRPIPRDIVHSPDEPVRRAKICS
jgi:hypothetical protein